MTRILLFWAILIIVSCSKVEVKTIAEVAAATKLTFPSDAEITRYESNGSVIDEIWICKIEFEDKNSQTFLDDLNLKKTEQGGFSALFSDDVAWWKPKNIIAHKLYSPDDMVYVNTYVTQEGSNLHVYIEHMVF